MQVGRDMLGVLCSVETTRCVMWSRLGSANIRETQKAAPPLARRGSSLAKYADSFLFRSGGFNFDTDVKARVEVYDLAINTWSEAPRLNMRRSHHSSCVAGHVLAVFGGAAWGERGECHLETIDAHAVVRGGEVAWERIPLSIPRRSHAMMVALNSAEIFIAGGEGGTEAGQDSYVVNLNDRTTLVTAVCAGLNVDSDYN